MPKHIASGEPGHEPIVDMKNPLLPLSYFHILKLAQGQTATYHLLGYESVVVVMSGTCRIDAGEAHYATIGARRDIWDGLADSVYVPTGVPARITGLSLVTELAVAGGQCESAYASFRIRPAAVETVEVGSLETHTRRRICHILGPAARGKAGRLLVSELYADAGCWAGYPPHKHDTDRVPEESAFEEIYHYRFNPSCGFGAQYVFQEDGRGAVYMTRTGSTVLIDEGYHPSVTAPGYRMYIFTILVGKTQRSLVQYFHPEHRPLMSLFPGLDAMREKFK